MNIAVILDNNVSKVLVTPLEKVSQRNDKINVRVFVGENNKGDTSNIALDKIFLNHRNEVLNALSTPLSALRRLKENTLPRMDYYYFSLRRYLKDFDVVYTQDVSRSLYTLAALKQYFKYRIVLGWWENLPFKFLFSEKDTVVAQRSLDKVDLFLPPTQMAKDALMFQGIAEEKIVHLYPGVDTVSFVPANNQPGLRRKYLLPDDKYVVLFVGRLVSHKGVHILPWAAKILQTKGLLERFVFVIAGDGEQMSYLKKSVSAMGLENYFKFLGWVPYDTLPEIYQMSDFFVLPSIMKEDIQEQFGLVIAEAMSCGKPVIGSAVGAIPEVIGDAGIIVSPGDYKALTEAIKEMAFNDEVRLKLGAKARKRAEDLFSGDKNAERLASLLLSLK